LLRFPVVYSELLLEGDKLAHLRHRLALRRRERGAGLAALRLRRAGAALCGNADGSPNPTGSPNPSPPPSLRPLALFSLACLCSASVPPPRSPLQSRRGTHLTPYGKIPCNVVFSPWRRSNRSVRPAFVSLHLLWSLCPSSGWPAEQGLGVLVGGLLAPPRLGGGSRGSGEQKLSRGGEHFRCRASLDFTHRFMVP